MIIHLPAHYQHIFQILFHLNLLLQHYFTTHRHRKVIRMVVIVQTDILEVQIVPLTIMLYHLRSIIHLLSHTTLSVSGIGSFYPDTTSPLANSSYLSDYERNELKQEQAYGDMLLRFFDKDGKECNTSLRDRTLSISFDRYRKIPCKIIVASGEHKAHTLHAALKGGLADVLVISEDLAVKLMELL